MIRINLLPHREMRRERRKKDFVGSAVLAGIVGAVLVFAGGMLINQQIENQATRNGYIQEAIKKLDVEIAEIQTLEASIASLKARQQAVEDLQSDRTTPVHLFDELVRLMPEGVFLEQLVQSGLKVSLTGIAQSNERVAELLRNLSERSEWMESPNLDEIKELAVQGPSAARTGNVRQAYEFRLNVLVKRRTQQAGQPPGQPPARRAHAPADAQFAMSGR